jgi:hypothetical protein
MCDQDFHEKASHTGAVKGTGAAAALLEPACSPVILTSFKQPSVSDAVVGSTRSDAYRAGPVRRGRGAQPARQADSATDRSHEGIRAAGQPPGRDIDEVKRGKSLEHGEPFSGEHQRINELFSLEPAARQHLICDSHEHSARKLDRCIRVRQMPLRRPASNAIRIALRQRRKIRTDCAYHRFHDHE